MTRARALKSVIRSRIAKTGERYTTARRHVLAARPPALRASRPRRPCAARTPVPTAAAKGSVSDATARARTGHGLDHWFAVLDRVRRGGAGAHRRRPPSVRHAQGAGWYAQGITVAYERARGVRAVNQRRDGVYEVSATKIVAAGTREVVDRLQRRAATGALDQGARARPGQGAGHGAAGAGIEGFRRAGRRTGALSLPLGRPRPCSSTSIPGPAASRRSSSPTASWRPPPSLKRAAGNGARRGPGWRHTSPRRADRRTVAGRALWHRLDPWAPRPLDGDRVAGVGGVRSGLRHAVEPQHRAAGRAGAPPRRVAHHRLPAFVD